MPPTPGRPALARRALLLGGAAVSSGTAFRVRPARAQDRVFLNYTQADLDTAYDQSAWTPDGAAYQAAYGADSAAVRASYKPATKSYGPSAAEALDVFRPKFPGRAPILVFLHGGAWLRLTKDDAATPAPTVVDAGGVYIAPNFANARDVGLVEMAEQCRRAFRWVVEHAASCGGDANRIVLAGHSSGAHLAAVLLTTDWTQYGLPADTIKAGLLMSGVYDLYPVMLSSRRSYLKLSPDGVAALSPLRHLDRLRCPVTIAWGDGDSPEFKRQSVVMADAVAGMGLLHARQTLFNTHHFAVPRQLDRPDTPLGHAALGMMGLA